MISRMPQIRRPAHMRRLVSLMLILSVLLAMTGPLQIAPTPHGEEPVIMTLNVCETGVPMAHVQGSSPWIFQPYTFLEPLFAPVIETGKAERLIDSIRVTSLDRPPRTL